MISTAEVVPALQQALGLAAHSRIQVTWGGEEIEEGSFASLGIEDEVSHCMP